MTVQARESRAVMVGSEQPAGPRLAVVVAMKPQLRGRVRRNVETLLELGLRVIVVSVRTRKEFFVGLESPRLTAHFLEVKTVSGRYNLWLHRDRVRRTYIRGQRLDRARRRHIRTTLRLRRHPWAMLRHVRAQPLVPAPFGAPVTPFPRWLMTVVLVVTAPIVAVMMVLHGAAVAVQQISRLVQWAGERTFAWGVRHLPATRRMPVSRAGHRASDRLGEFGQGARRVLRRVSGQLLRSAARAARRVVRIVRVYGWEPASRAAGRLRGRILDVVAGALQATNRINMYTSFWRSSEQVVRDAAPDLVVSSDLPGLVGASRAARALGIRHVHDCHELFLESTGFKRYEQRFLAPIERRHMKRAARVIAVNRSIADEYSQRYGVRPLVVRNCANPQTLTSARDIRDLAGIEEGCPVVLYQGGFSVGRGLDVCIAAMSDVPRAAHLVMLGYGPLGADLIRMAEQHGVADRVHVVAAVPPEELLAYTASATVGLIPYQPESKNNYYSLPNKIFEYTSVGLPIVASDLPELRRVAVDAGCGLVYDPYDPASLADAITTAIAPGLNRDFRIAAERYGVSNNWVEERKILIESIEHALGSTASVPIRELSLAPAILG